MKVPEATLKVLAKCLASKPEKRLATAGALLEALGPLLSDPGEFRGTAGSPVLRAATPPAPRPKQDIPRPADEFHPWNHATPGQQWTNSLEMKFAWVPAGKFWMGGGGGTVGNKQIEIAQGFYLGVYPVTQEQWQGVMGYNPSHFSRIGEARDKAQNVSDSELREFPVEHVSWHDAQEFIKKINQQEKGTNWVYRLPTEAEWEYACRGAVTTEEQCSYDFYFEQPTNDVNSEQANFDGNFPAGRGRKGKHLERTTKVGSYRPNQLGIFDMHGNVLEWCEDVYEVAPTTTPWPGRPVFRVHRGGSWYCIAEYCRAARPWCSRGSTENRFPRPSTCPGSVNWQVGGPSCGSGLTCGGRV